MERVALVFFAVILLFCSQESLRADSAPPPTDPATRAYRQRQDEANAVNVLRWLQAGNLRFAFGRSNHGGYPADGRERIRITAQGQRPLAAVLSCIDSRTTPELIFDTSVGDLFTARVGGTEVNEDIVGSLEIAASSGIKVIVVLGHTDCAAIKGACSGEELGHFTQLLERIKPSIAATAARLDHDPSLSRYVGERVVENRRYVAEVSHMHAAQVAARIQAQSPILREMIARREIVLVSAIFDVDTGRVTLDGI